MSIFKDYWPESDSVVELLLSAAPSSISITAVKVFYFDDGELLLVRVPKGWDIPGGHVETGENPEKALIREVKEETQGVLKTHKLVGHLKITKAKDTKVNKHYPKEAAINLYIGQIEDYGGELLHESNDVKRFKIDELSKVFHHWNDFNNDLIALIHDHYKRLY